MCHNKQPHSVPEPFPLSYNGSIVYVKVLLSLGEWNVSIGRLAPPSCTLSISFLGSDVTNVSIERALFKPSSTRVAHAFGEMWICHSLGTRLVLYLTRVRRLESTKRSRNTRTCIQALVCRGTWSGRCCWHVARKIKNCHAKRVTGFWMVPKWFKDIYSSFVLCCASRNLRLLPL